MKLSLGWTSGMANQPRGTQRYRAILREGEDALTQAIVQLASKYGRYGYRRITALLQRAGWRVGKPTSELTISFPTANCSPSSGRPGNRPKGSGAKADFQKTASETIATGKIVT